MNPLKTLFAEYGQAIWLDFVARGFVAGGDLARMVEADDVRGVTSNPSIFEKAIGHSAEYDDALRASGRDPGRPVIGLYEDLAIADIQAAADVLRPVYDATAGQDGYVSLEVSPYLALDTDATLAEARRLWSAVGRDNLMVKVPATGEGVPAIRALIGDGINVNVTLLFAQDRYEDVAEAYLDGLETLARAGGDPGRVASVASFFISRIDAAVDKELDARIAAANDPDEKAALAGLKGKVAIANAKLAYQRYLRLFGPGRFDALAAKGARPQRLLWASTGTKNKAYPDTLYVDELIGPDTVNTVPPATLDAFRDHGRPRASLQEGVAEAEEVLRRLARAGISLDTITARLVEEGVALFKDAADALLGAVAGKRMAVLGQALGRQTLALGDALSGEVTGLAENWRQDGRVRRLWAGDATVWTGADEARWLGWLDVLDREEPKLDRYRQLSEEIRRDGFTDALLLGMGGSSLGPEVLAETFGQRPGFPRLRILDSTDPAQVRATVDAVDLARTVVIVSSKSGSTLEPNVFRDYVLARMQEAVGAEQAGSRFIAVTDPGSAMEAAARRDGFRHVFHGEPGIGGRYSVLSAFGLVPAAVMGLDLAALVQSARAMMRSCGPDVPPNQNPGIQLGLAMGAAAKAGRDKITMVAPAALKDFGAWAEQLIAESTGKDGLGLIPVDGEPLGAPGVYGQDRLFVQLRLDGRPDAAQDAALAALEAAGQPVIRIDLARPDDIVQEFFRFEFATAVAGAVLGINPFDQPDVEASKIKTRELTDAFDRDGSLPAETPIWSGEGVQLYTDARNAEALGRAGASDLAGWLRAHLGRAGPGDYVAFLAYLERNAAHTELLTRMRRAVRDSKRVATCVGFGPRFLHSTGQAYKGGPNTGVFLQITGDPPADLAVPGRRATFGSIEAAQARGDFGVLAERGRRVLRVHLTGSASHGGLQSVAAALGAALG
ncbi:bifunctional transaldolase/phosoglucose isomerase [Enterovirga sp.]|uniref:bifunctional transaldolase/phosoglucose isomerase n=1 Tax=Enterovirga sp. TaxID=2026350 RepID=UPI00260878E0|nr:bifunctional transaldolase/phosoglucose isomerase [Enterovirga sp.]MDB5590107.1 putative Transaldolase Phosphoglucose isomerase [Enterovirga sp.]